MILGTMRLDQMRPQPKQRARTFVRGGKVISATPPATVAYEQYVAASWRGPRCFEGVVKVTIAVQEGPGHPADLDNFVKVILDGLNGVAWVDDKQVVAIDAKIHRGQDRPAIDVIVEGWEAAE